MIAPSLFTTAVETLRRTAGIEFDQPELIEFVGANWPGIQHSPDAVAWAARFAEQMPKE